MEHVRIVKMYTVPAIKVRVLRLYIGQWPQWYGPGGPGDAAADIDAACRAEGLPLALVALGADNALLGTVTLKETSLGSGNGIGPWLGALVVEPARRRQGIGGALIDAGQNLARELGFSEIYATTDAAVGLLTARGWKPNGLHAQSQRGELAIYCKPLT